MVWLSHIMKNIHMNHKELVDLVSSNIFKLSGKIKSGISMLAMRNYLELIDDIKFQAILKEK